MACGAGVQIPCSSAPTSPPPAVPRTRWSAAWSAAARSIQFFNQSPRAWKPRVYSDEEVAAFHEAIDGSDVDALLIHAVYLLNCASEDPEIRDKSLTALTAALRAGEALGAVGVVLHPGSALKDGGPVDEAIERARRRRSREALAESRELPAAPRGHGRRRRHARPLVRGARER